LISARRGFRRWRQRFPGRSCGGQVFDADAVIHPAIAHRPPGNTDFDPAAARDQLHRVAATDQPRRDQVVGRQQAAGLQGPPCHPPHRCGWIGQGGAGNARGITGGSGDIGGGDGFSSGNAATQDQHRLHVADLERHEQAPAAGLRAAHLDRAVAGCLGQQRHRAGRQAQGSVKHGLAFGTGRQRGQGRGPDRIHRLEAGGQGRRGQQQARYKNEKTHCDSWMGTGPDDARCVPLAVTVRRRKNANAPSSTAGKRRYRLHVP
jgi:hypothetical protein